jgi:hypothetical protein
MDLIEHLFGHRAKVDDPTRTLGLGNKERPILQDIDKGKANVVPAPIRGRKFPIRKVSSGALTTTFNDVSSKTSCRKEIIVCLSPTIFIDKGAKDKGTIGTTSF